ncbi:hypothetical protein [Gordonia sihwensis]|uniref:hypothetical protein n=1 Tax=Gordonia sihwensis TaxID=173559 RepID=UPI003D9795BE
MSALTEEVLVGRRVETTRSPQELTKLRRQAERRIGRSIAPSKKELALYRAEGLEPPTS